MAQIEAAEPFPLRTVKARRAVSWSRALGAGALAGEVGGVAMALMMSAFFHFGLSKSPFLPFEAVGASVLAFPAHGTVLGSMHAVAELLGFAVHMLVPSLVWGTIFGVVAALARPRTASALLWLGIAVGVLAQVVDVYILLPTLANAGVLADRWTPAVHPIASWLFHLAFGVGLTLYPWTYDAELERFV